MSSMSLKLEMYIHISYISSVFCIVAFKYYDLDQIFGVSLHTLPYVKLLVYHHAESLYPLEKFLVLFINSLPKHAYPGRITRRVDSCLLQSSGERQKFLGGFFYFFLLKFKIYLI